MQNSAWRQSTGEDTPEEGKNKTPLLTCQMIGVQTSFEPPAKDSPRALLSTLITINLMGDAPATSPSPCTMPGLVQEMARPSLTTATCQTPELARCPRGTACCQLWDVCKLHGPRGLASFHPRKNPSQPQWFGRYATSKRPPFSLKQPASYRFPAH